MLQFVRSWWGATLCSLGLLFGSLALISSSALLTPTVASAQQDDKLSGEGLVKPAVAGDAAAAGTTQKRERFLTWLYKSLGWMYSLVFLFLSFTLVALVIMNVMAVRRDKIVPAALAQNFEALLGEKRYQEAYELAKADDSFLGNVLAAGMAKVSAGYDESVKAMQDTGSEESMRLEHLLGYVSLIAQIGPMFGLLGTVDGMVQAFEEIAITNTTPKPNQLAAGISTALVTTIVGLWIAIPSIAFFTIVRARVARLLQEVSTVSDSLMSRFANVGKK